MVRYLGEKNPPTVSHPSPHLLQLRPLTPSPAASVQPQDSQLVSAGDRAPPHPADETRGEGAQERVRVHTHVHTRRAPTPTPSPHSRGRDSLTGLDSHLLSDGHQLRHLNSHGEIPQCLSPGGPRHLCARLPQLGLLFSPPLCLVKSHPLQNVAEVKALPRHPCTAPQRLFTGCPAPGAE